MYVHDVHAVPKKTGEGFRVPRTENLSVIVMSHHVGARDETTLQPPCEVSTEPHLMI